MWPWKKKWSVQVQNLVPGRDGGMVGEKGRGNDPSHKTGPRRGLRKW